MSAKVLCPSCTVTLRVVREAYRVSAKTSRGLIANDPDHVSQADVGLVSRAGCPHLADGRTVDEFVEAHPQGAQQETVAKALGVTANTVWRIEQSAIAKLRAGGADSLAVFAFLCGLTEEEALNRERKV